MSRPDWGHSHSLGIEDWASLTHQSASRSQPLRVHGRASIRLHRIRCMWGIGAVSHPARCWRCHSSCHSAIGLPNGRVWTLHLCVCDSNHHPIAPTRFRIVGLRRSISSFSVICHFRNKFVVVWSNLQVFVVRSSVTA